MSYTCREPTPESLCTTANTCGSPTQPCSVDVKRSASAASATPSTPEAKGNKLFCVKVDTSVIWRSDTKHEGLVVDIGPTSPFDPPDDIIGSSGRKTAVAQFACCRFRVLRHCSLRKLHSSLFGQLS